MEWNGPEKVVPIIHDEHGVEILNPSVFYAASAAICALVAISVGSSWTVAGTLGIGLVGIAGSFELSPAITAGAIISKRI